MAAPQNGMAMSGTISTAIACSRMIAVGILSHNIIGNQQKVFTIGSIGLVLPCAFNSLI